MTGAAGFDAVMMIAFGGPEHMDEVRPFLSRVLAGRPVPPERFESVVHHYEQIGGRSPLGEITRNQAAALHDALARGGIRSEVLIGMRHSPPFLRDTLAAVRVRGGTRVLGVIMAAHEGPASHGRYREATEAARRELGADAPAVEYSAGFHLHAGFITANVEHTRAAYAQLSAELRASAQLVFTAHSVPASSATPYAAQVAESAQLVAAALGARDYRIAYQSRSGSPRDPWLEPDINHVIREEAARGTRALVVCPIGFVCDHVEVLYDLDVEAAQTARDAGLALARASSAGVHPQFIAALRDRVREASSAG
jgi:ferrochelatase